MLRNTLKIAVSGTNHTGKSCLCGAMTGRALETEYSCTIGVDLMVKHIIRKHDNISLQFWDLAGLNRFHSIIISYIRKCSVLIFCYSSEDYNSFLYIMDMYHQYKNCKYIDDKHIIIVATKADSKNATPGFEEWGETFAKDKGFPFIKTSAYTKEGVEELTEACMTIPNTLVSPIIPEHKYVKKERGFSYCCLS